MAQYTSKIVNSWSLTAFALLKGPKMKVGDFTNAKLPPYTQWEIEGYIESLERL
jgi:hypothetical protein